MFILAILKSTSFDAGKKFILDDVLAVRGPVQEPAFNILMNTGKTWDAPEINNPEAINYFKDTTVNAAYTATATTIVLDNKKTKPINVKPNMKIFNVTTGETMKTSSSSSDIVVAAGTSTTINNISRAVDSTTAAAGNAGDVVVIGNPIHNEDTNFGDSDAVTSKITKYLTQIFMHAFDETYTAEAIENMIANGDANFLEQQNRILKQLEDDILVQAFRGVHGSSSSNAESGYKEGREMDGIINAYTRSGQSIINLGAALDLKTLGTYLSDIDDAKLPLQKVPAYAGSTDAEFVIFANGRTRNSLDNSLDTSNIRRQQETKRIVRGVTGIEVAGINVDLVKVPPSCLANGWIVIMHKAQYDLRFLQNSTPRIQKVEVQHRGKKFGISAEAGGRLRFPDTIKVVKGITL